MHNDLVLITSKIDTLFTRAMHTRYWLVVVDDHFDQQYNFFFHSLKKGHRERSIPLHSVTQYDLIYLERLLAALRQHTQLSIYFRNFEGQFWPSNHYLIQRNDSHAHSTSRRPGSNRRPIL
ncbi:acetyl-CoA carboxylase [Lacticaseibacillus saniviri]|uniref:Acetyl-CoA carboxylase n=1 Tax=Lacticaseibacillus saniviri JCM 17471 = DSM 24301 TaxID=1293598 RepID=A0A0R2MTD2_9LACO|nr:acetyl-CoA carboxylase [Lacticaseibacillus saniviri]KRO15602.1 hypothetical protein IV56_GL002372 [Lacticaseibacillus saniviri JCM 17471 = DSM 24301]MCG4282515.1 acetyl-CoA carboxylase [Lacticaseibacillus saniviri]